MPVDVERAQDERFGYFGPGSASWQVNREVTVLFGGARALLMHAAHPLVIAGARQTGAYERDAWKRLERTLHLQYLLTFGSRADADAAAARIRRLHDSVHGIDAVTGRRYDANDPDLLLWVHACLVDSSLLFERLTVGTLDDEGRLRYHREQMLAAELLGLPRDRIPPTVNDLRRYIDDVVAGDELVVGPDALSVAHLIRRPPAGVPWRPALRLVAPWAFGSLPAGLRQAYGLRWGALRQFNHTGSLAAVRRIRPMLPVRVRLILPARLAEERVERVIRAR